MSALVEVQLAGGHVSVGTAEFPATGMRMVSFRAPSGEFPMHPDEARRLAVRLIEAAAAAEAEEPAPWP